MTKFSVAKNALIPADDAARKVLAKHTIGDIVDADVLHGINQRFNNLMFAVISKLAEASGTSINTMKTRLLVWTGRYEEVPATPGPTGYGRKVLVVPSMSRAQMTASERESFWNDMREVVEKDFLPYINQRDAEEIRNMMADEETAGI